MKQVFKIKSNNENKEYKKDEVTLIYDIKLNKKKIKIFGENFVENNRNNYIIFNLFKKLMIKIFFPS